jgi:branched-chain amino acid transport system permease protein
MSSGRLNLVFYGVLIVLAAAIPALDNVFYTRLATQIAIYGMVALSVDLLVGYGGLLTFGQAAFFGVGAYVTGILSTHGVHSAFLVWPAAIVAAMLCALVIGALALRTSGFQFIMVTLAFAQMIYYFWLSLRSLGGENGFSIPKRNTLGGVINLESHVTFYYVALVLLIAVTALTMRLVHSQFGMVVQGGRDNERRLTAIGFPPFRYKLVLFCISGGIAGLAGALIANQTSHVGADLLSWQQSGNFLAMVILGSSGTLIGPIFGAAVFVLFEQVVSSMTQHWLFYLGILIVLRILLFKGSIFHFLAPGQGPTAPSTAVAPEVSESAAGGQPMAAEGAGRLEPGAQP